MNNKTYDILKQLALVWIPMIAAIVIGVGEIWGIEIMTPIGATITLIDTALGMALEKLSSDYKKMIAEDNFKAKYDVKVGDRNEQ